MTQFSKWKTIGYAAAIFVTGAVSGGALGIYETKSDLFAPPREQEMALRMLNRLKNRLQLTPEQVAKIKPVINQAASELHSIRSEMAQRIGKVFDDSYAQVAAVLTPEQKAKLDQMEKERREMDRRWHAGGGPGGPRRDGQDHPDLHGPPYPGPQPGPSAS